MDENRIAAIDESGDIFAEAEDESDQAKASNGKGLSGSLSISAANISVSSCCIYFCSTTRKAMRSTI